MGIFMVGYRSASGQGHGLVQQGGGRAGLPMLTSAGRPAYWASSGWSGWICTRISEDSIAVHRRGVDDAAAAVDAVAGDLEDLVPGASSAALR